MLMAIPSLPSDHLYGGRVCSVARLQTRQLMVMKYDVIIETLPRELIAFRAVDEPRLMHPSKVPTTRETESARSGIS